MLCSIPAAHSEKQMHIYDLNTNTEYSPATMRGQARATVMDSPCADRKRESQDRAELLHKNMIINGRVGLFKLNSYIKNGRSILRAKFRVRSKRI